MNKLFSKKSKHQTEKRFIPSTYEQWKAECKEGARAILTQPCYYTTNERFRHLVAWKQELTNANQN